MIATGSYGSGGTIHQLVSSPRCRTCRSPQRRTVELSIAEGKSYSEVARGLPDGAKLTAKNIREHCRRGHLAVQREVIRRTIEAAGVDQADMLETGASLYIRALATASAVVEEVSRRIALNEIELSFSEGLKAARLLADFDESARRDRNLEGLIHEAHRSIEAILGIIKELMEPGQWSELLRTMERDTLLSPFIPRPASGGGHALASVMAPAGSNKKAA